MLITLPMDTPPTAMISCTDGCGNQGEVTMVEQIWQRMEFGKGFRCPDCFRALQAVNQSSTDSASELTTAAKKP